MVFSTLSTEFSTYQWRNLLDFRLVEVEKSTLSTEFSTIAQKHYVIYITCKPSKLRLFIYNAFLFDFGEISEKTV